MPSKKENNMKRFLQFFSMMTMMFLFTLSCRPVFSEYRPEDYSFSPNPNEYNFPAIFKSYWTGMNRNYLFWETDPTDWDAVYDEYKPKFDALGIFPSVDLIPPSPEFSVACIQAFSYFKEMSKNLLDGHFRIDFDPLVNGILSGAKEAGLLPYSYDVYPLTDMAIVRFTVNRMQERPGFDEMDPLFISNNWDSDSPTSPASEKDDDHRYSFNYFEHIIKEKYLDNTKSGVIPMRSPDVPPGYGWPYFETNFRAGTGRINDEAGFILYLHFSNFGLFAINNGDFDGLMMFDSMTAPIQSVKDVINQFLNDLTASNLKGVIVDMRGNYGGDYRDWDLLWKRMIDAPLTFASVRTKSGEGRLDYGPWTPFILDPRTPDTDTRRLTDTLIPVVALVDKFTGSAAEMSTLIVKAMPNGHVIGERTMGSISPMGAANSQIFNGGQFDGGKFWTHVTCAFLQVQDLDGHINEMVGIPPDAEVGNNWDNFLRGTDERLEAAISYIKSK
jgi:hypothetical protein